MAGTNGSNGSTNGSTRHFGDNLKVIRTRHSLSMAQLGRMAGLSHSEISRLEAGVREPRLATILALARALEVEGSELLHGLR